MSNSNNNPSTPFHQSEKGRSILKSMRKDRSIEILTHIIKQLGESDIRSRRIAEETLNTVEGIMAGKHDDDLVTEFGYADLMPHELEKLKD